MVHHLWECGGSGAYSTREDSDQSRTLQDTRRPFWRKSHLSGARRPPDFHVNSFNIIATRPEITLSPTFRHSQHIASTGFGSARLHHG